MLPGVSHVIDRRRLKARQVKSCGTALDILADGRKL
jgi:hypothetical protein